MKIYTKTGDRGETGLLGGARVPKDHPRVAAYGDVDETNAAIGAVRALAEGPLERLLFRVQKDLFAIGAQLADPTHEVAAERAKAAVTPAQGRQLERAIDAREKGLPPLRSFVLPGGTPTSALLHQARTVCRRAERSVVGLSRQSGVDPRIVVYLNRLSDLLFVLARAENRRAGIDEERW
ncbi:MAG TPA: cob(I)yrinic acid a,c-diamide adenosyltransferase [Vicinamibacteria bacterium]|nr:cob(I)yrinic acid a,c-diamide adenosyltransferase [Vicinamibacteria bacterium]